MKKLSIVIALAAVTFGAQAQNAKSNAIKLNPLSLAFATGNVAYERAIGQQSSLQLGGFYSGVSIGGIKYAGWGVTPEFRQYFAGHKEALNGVYVAPFARYQNFSIEEKDAGNKTTFSTMGGGALIGWQKMWGSGFTLDLFAGPSYNKAKFKNDNDDETFDVSGGFSGFGVRTGITIGFGF